MAIPRGRPPLHGCDFGVLRLGQQEYVRRCDDLAVRSEPGNLPGELLVAEAEPVAVAVLKYHPAANLGVDPLQVGGVQGQT